MVSRVPKYKSAVRFDPKSALCGGVLALKKISRVAFGVQSAVQSRFPEKSHGAVHVRQTAQATLLPPTSLFTYHEILIVNVNMGNLCVLSVPRPLKNP